MAEQEEKPELEFVDELPPTGAGRPTAKWDAIAAELVANKDKWAVIEDHGQDEGGRQRAGRRKSTVRATFRSRDGNFEVVSREGRVYARAV